MEQALGGVLDAVLLVGIIHKDRSASEAKHLMILEEVTDPLVRIAELTAVALVEDEDDLLVPLPLHHLEVFALADGGVELLQGCNYELGIIGELLHELGGVIRGIHTALGEAVELLDRLIVEILTINAEDHLMHVCTTCEDLTRLEGGQRLTRSRGVPDVAITVSLWWVLHPIYNRLSGVVLVRT